MNDCRFIGKRKPSLPEFLKSKEPFENLNPPRYRNGKACPVTVSGESVN